MYSVNKESEFYKHCNKIKESVEQNNEINIDGACKLDYDQLIEKVHPVHFYFCSYIENEKIKKLDTVKIYNIYYYLIKTCYDLSVNILQDKEASDFFKDMPSIDSETYKNKKNQIKTQTVQNNTPEFMYKQVFSFIDDYVANKDWCSYYNSIEQDDNKFTFIFNYMNDHINLDIENEIPMERNKEQREELNKVEKFIENNIINEPINDLILSTKLEEIVNMYPKIEKKPPEEIYNQEFYENYKTEYENLSFNELLSVYEQIEYDNEYGDRCKYFILNLLGDYTTLDEYIKENENNQTVINELNEIIETIKNNIENINKTTLQTFIGMLTYGNSIEKKGTTDNKEYYEDIVNTKYKNGENSYTIFEFLKHNIMSKNKVCKILNYIYNTNDYPTEFKIKKNKEIIRYVIDE